MLCCLSWLLVLFGLCSVAVDADVPVSQATTKPLHISPASFSPAAFAGLFLAALITFFCSFPAVAQTDSNKSAVQDGTGRTYAIAVPNYAGLTDKQSDQMTDSIEKQQEALKADLVAQLTQNNLSVEAKGEIIQLVGEFRVYKAVNLLTENIDFFQNRSSGNGIPSTNTAIEANGGYVAREALLELGNTSFFAILEVIGSRNKDVPFDKARVNGYCWVLSNIRGSTYTTQQLEKQLTAEKSPKVQAQYRSVLARMKAFPAD